MPPTSSSGAQHAAAAHYAARIAAMRAQFEQDQNGPALVAARADAADELVTALWAQAEKDHETLLDGVAVFAVGGYGRRALFPFSDLDLLFVLSESWQEKSAKVPIRAISQALWDAGVRVAPTTRLFTECDHVDPENIEFTLSLLDLRPLAGDETVRQRLARELLPHLIERERHVLLSGLERLVAERHAKYGNTLFHLEPNIKDCPGGLRDANVVHWLRQIATSAPTDASRAEALPRPFRGGGGSSIAEDSPDRAREFAAAMDFLTSARSFLHLRHGRDINTLDWESQDAAAAAGIGLLPGRGAIDAAYWMQIYFRHARSVERRLVLALDTMPRAQSFLDRLPRALRRKPNVRVEDGFRIEENRAILDLTFNGDDPAHDPEIVLDLFLAVARDGVRLSAGTEERIEESLPLLSMNLEEGADLWQQFSSILSGRHAGAALRSMHTLGLLELLVPEFHGVDALVIRDAYHRYTVDEHTFVLIDTLHSLDKQPSQGPLGEWPARFHQILNDLDYPELLYLAGLLHDVGKGRSTGAHTIESARLATSVLERLEIGSYESGLVLNLIRNHIEMSSALRRDIFDAETVRAFAAKVQTPEELRMLTLFTYADIHAVHPDALTPWKAENLWRLYIATSNYLDRNIDEERVDTRVSSELVRAVSEKLPTQTREVLAFLEGFPQRYLRTRTPEQIVKHFEMAEGLGKDAVQLDFEYAADDSEVTLITRDRAGLFANVSGALAAWGMNIVTADAFSNAQGLVVDSFRFTDSFRTLELNPEERDHFLKGVHDAMLDAATYEKMLASRRRSRRRTPLRQVETKIEFDTESSTHSTILQVVAQDVPGLLHTLAGALGEAGCNIEVAVIDTEGEMAIDVFYLTRDSHPLNAADLPVVEERLAQAIAANASPL